MLNPVPMLKLDLRILERDERAVLRSLGQQGVLQWARQRLDPDPAAEAPPDFNGDIARCTHLLDRCEALWALVNPLSTKPGTGPATDDPLPAIETRLRSLEEQTRDRLAQRQQLVHRQTELDTLHRSMVRYQGLDIPMGPPSRFSFLHCVTGTIPPGNFSALRNALADSGVLIPLPMQENLLPVVILTTPRRRPPVEQTLKSLDFLPDSLPATPGLTTGRFLEQTLNERKQAADSLATLDESLATLATKAVELLGSFRQRLLQEKCLLEASKHFSRTETTVLISGWLPAAEASALTRRLKAVTQDRLIIQTAPPVPGEPVPVLFQHSLWLRPFGRLVSSYGLPGYWELEPTLFVAISYVFMFGMMFGDAGQGAVLTLAGLGALRSGHAQKTRDIGLFLLLGGLSSIAFGLLYGSYFGIPQLKPLALWRDPLEGSPMELMLTAIIVGVVIISLGLFLNIINCFRKGDWTGGFLGRFGIAGILFYWGVLALLLKYFVFQTHGQFPLAALLLLAVPLLGWTLKDPIEASLHHHRHPSDPHPATGAMIAESLIGAFEGLLTYFANTTSFVRLAAYAMSHAALLMAAFTVAAELKRSAPGGDFWGLLVIIAGNLLALLLEGIIAAVQALRLEYYEFFGKFFSSAGQPFAPFRLEGERA